MINNCRVTKTIMISLGAMSTFAIINGLVYFFKDKYCVAIAIFLIALVTIILIFKINGD